MICHGGPSARVRQRRWGWLASHGLRAMGRLASARVPPRPTSPHQDSPAASTELHPSGMRPRCCRDSPFPSRTPRGAAARQTGAPSGARSARWRAGEAGARTRTRDAPRCTRGAYTTRTLLAAWCSNTRLVVLEPCTGVAPGGVSCPAAMSSPRRSGGSFGVASGTGSCRACVVALTVGWRRTREAAVLGGVHTDEEPHALMVTARGAHGTGMQRARTCT